MDEGRLASLCGADPQERTWNLPKLSNDVRTITGTATITGSSGRFENAQGQGVLDGLLPSCDVEGEWVFPRQKHSATRLMLHNFVFQAGKSIPQPSGARVLTY